MALLESSEISRRLRREQLERLQSQRLRDFEEGLGDGTDLSMVTEPSAHGYRSHAEAEREYLTQADLDLRQELARAEITRTKAGRA